MSMDLDPILRIQARIDQIFGVTPDDGTSAVANAPQSGRFGAMVQQALQNQDGTSQSAPTAPTAAPGQIDGLVQSNAATFGVDPNLIRAVIANESNFNPNATSNAGAQGLMQLMPDTAASLGVTNSYDPTQNVWGGTRYLRSMIDRFGGDLPKAIAAYNAGPEAVERYGGIPPYPETQAYVNNVLGTYEQYKNR
jgi:soluble lytic murein transglycosylase-like protein